MLPRSDFDSEGELGEVVGTIYSVYLDSVQTDSVLLEENIVRSIDWLGLLYDL